MKIKKKQEEIDDFRLNHKGSKGAKEHEGGTYGFRFVHTLQLPACHPER
ncbi:MAG: hypothetical protein JWP27_643 [Flaviaesturariibacter sp.]|nr:hypothetical protein [Flaviaesturariibacter sp.]